MSKKMLYVAMTRATNKAHINFCNIENYKHHTGHIYSYEHKGKYYIGSTTDLNKRQQEHRTGTKTGNTKSKKQFNYTVLITSITRSLRQLSFQISTNCWN